ncbi:hypothetical protein P691DRAFT_840753 [Macrolepiota fuliginosa MF-IS2]|uniref:Uncharacterized protein n=1 Tax=Macrolepiota fuliginosa MF-IS2 TaxID=1400762 RepID=A0A9P5X483_9AGAR|nr:hypothetical protein P691DRAFT_840753 [Macrolepiota fuliginosa MF-IS2]
MGAGTGIPPLAWPAASGRPISESSRRTLTKGRWERLGWHFRAGHWEERALGVRLSTKIVALRCQPRVTRYLNRVKPPQQSANPLTCGSEILFCHPDPALLSHNLPGMRREYTRAGENWWGVPGLEHDRILADSDPDKDGLPGFRAYQRNIGCDCLRDSSARIKPKKVKSNKIGGNEGESKHAGVSVVWRQPKLYESN